MLRIPDYTVGGRIVGHLKLTFAAQRPPPPHVAYQDVLLAADISAEYFFFFFLPGERGLRYLPRF